MLCIAVGLLLVALILGMVKSCGKDEVTKNPDKLPTSNQLLLGFKEIGSVGCDYDVLKKNIMKDSRFIGYDLKDEYCMVYQVTDFESEKNVKDFLGIKEALPEVNYLNSYMLLSVGRSIDDISDKNKKITESGEKIVDITFDESYSKDTVYLYTIKTTAFLSGTELDVYYLENNYKNCNFEEGERDNVQIISDGKYHKVYKKAEDVYEFVIKNAENKVSSRRILDSLPIITEYNDSMVRLEYEERDQYYNPQNDFYTTKSKYRLHYLRDTQIVFAKFSNDGRLLIVVRDAYNTSNYSYILTPPFSCDAKTLRNLIHSVEYVDSTHIKVELNFGEGQLIKEEVLTVPNLERKTSVS